MSVSENIAVVRKYFDACTSGNIDDLKSTMAPDVNHYFLPEAHKAIHGADHLARYWSKFQRVYRPKWHHDHIVGIGDEVVAEWTCLYRPANAEGVKLFRGTEWYVMRSGLIAEVRAYYKYENEQDCELTDFPYEARGYIQKTALKAPS